MMKEALDNIVVAIENDRTDIIKSIVSVCQTCEKDDEDVKVSRLLNTIINSTGTVLHLATQAENADAVRALLNAGADPCVQNEAGQTPLDLKPSEQVRQAYKDELLQATAQSNIGRVCQLLAAGLSINLIDSSTSQNTPLHWAATFSNSEMVQSLCSRGADVHAVNSEGCTPLHDAVKRGITAVVKELIKAGADPNYSSDTGKSALKSPVDFAEGKDELKNLLLNYKTLILQNGPAAELDSIAGDGSQVSQQASSGSLEGKPGSEPATPVSNGPTTPFPQVKNPTDNVTWSGGAELPPALTKIKETRLHHLWPIPQYMVQKPGDPFKPEGVLRVHIAQSINPGIYHSVAQMWLKLMAPLQPTLELHMDTSSTAPRLEDIHVVCEVNHRLFQKDESYRLSVSSKLVRLQASDLSGLFYGVTTFQQCLRLCGENGIPPLQINDWPQLKDRGVMLDISAGRRIKPEYLMTMVRQLSVLKVNQLQIYTRFAVDPDQESENIWQCSYAKNFLVDLDFLCHDCHISLLPVLDVSPKVSLDDLTDLQPAFQQFLSCFPSNRVVAVGPRLSSLVVDISEDGQVILDDARSVLCLPPDVTVELCAFVFHDSLDTLQDFPANAKLSEYGFQASYDFQEKAKLYADLGLPFSLLPGTAAWNSLAGCPEAAIRNIYSAVEAANTHNALGVVVCHWSGVGHVTNQSFSWPGILAGAGLSWNGNIPKGFLHTHLAEFMNLYVLHDAGTVLGQVIIELGRAETYVLRASRNQQGTECQDLPAEKGSTFFQLLIHPDQVSLDHLTTDVFQRAMRHVRKCQNELNKAHTLTHDGPQLVKEIQLTADLMLLTCRIGRGLVHTGRPPSGNTGYASINPGIANLTPTAKTDIANRLLSLTEQYRDLWLSRNLPQGLQESLAALSYILQIVVPGVHLTWQATPTT